MEPELPNPQTFDDLLSSSSSNSHAFSPNEISPVRRAEQYLSNGLVGHEESAETGQSRLHFLEQIRNQQQPFRFSRSRVQFPYREDV